VVLAALAVVIAASLMGRGTGGSSGSSTAGRVLAAGAPAPPVALVATTGTTVDLAAFRGKRNVLLYFYEHAG